MIEEVPIYIPGGRYEQSRDESRAILIAQFGGMDRGHWPAVLCARGDDLRADDKAAVSRQDGNTMEVSPRRSKDRRYPPRYQVPANHLREISASLHQPH